MNSKKTEKTGYGVLKPLLAKLPLAVTLCMFVVPRCEAKVVLPHFVTDSMVVQQNSRWNNDDG